MWIKKHCFFFLNHVIYFGSWKKIDCFCNFTARAFAVDLLLFVMLFEMFVNDELERMTKN
jgi:hypothetical protein